MISDVLGALSSLLGLAQNQKEMDRDSGLSDAVEKQLISLLVNDRFKKRTFKTIRNKVGGFDAEPDELRKHLVRIGAKRSGNPGEGEYWELASGDSDNRRKSRFRRSSTLSLFVSIVILALLASTAGPDTKIAKYEIGDRSFSDQGLATFSTNKPSLVVINGNARATLYLPNGTDGAENGTGLSIEASIDGNRCDFDQYPDQVPGYNPNHERKDISVHCRKIVAGGTHTVSFVAMGLGSCTPNVSCDTGRYLGTVTVQSLSFLDRMFHLFGLSKPF